MHISAGEMTEIIPKHRCIYESKSLIKNIKATVDGPYKK